MPSIRCPYCQHRMAFKGAKAGRYSSACPSCLLKFRIVISDDADEPPKVVADQAKRSKANTASATAVSISLESANADTAVGAPPETPPNGFRQTLPTPQPKAKIAQARKSSSNGKSKPQGKPSNGKAVPTPVAESADLNKPRATLTAWFTSLFKRR